MNEKLNDELKIYENPTLPEVADFAFHLLGSWWEDKGFETKTRNDYTKAEPKNEFGKYNVYDGKSEISKGLYKFMDRVFGDYNSYSEESIAMLMFPFALQQKISNSLMDNVFCHPKNEDIQVLVNFYIAMHFANMESGTKRDEAEKILKEIISETYTKILSAQMNKFDTVAITEKSKWSKIEELLKNIWTSQESESKKKETSVKIVRHYIFLGTKNALQNVFWLSETETEKLFKDTAENIQILYDNFVLDAINEPLESISSSGVMLSNPEILFRCMLIKSRKFGWQYRVAYGNENFVRFMAGDTTALSEDDINYLIANRDIQDKAERRIKLINDSQFYFVNSYIRLSKSKTKGFLQAFDSLGDDVVAEFFKNWWKARSIIFSIAFDDSEDDKEKIKDAVELFRDTFNQYKYFAGPNLREFLSDAIAADVYFNKKPIKDIIENTQDDTDEASILKTGKTYWEFGYAVGIFEEDSKKTYLVAYNAEKNFWNNFPAIKFTYQEKALNRYEEEVFEQELVLSKLVAEFNDEKKNDSLLSKENNRTRQKLGRRMYSNLSIAIMKAESVDDFTRIDNFIRVSDKKYIFANDENGATPLIRALNEYKNCVYGFSAEYRQKRDEILSKFLESQNCHRKIAEKCPNAGFYSEEASTASGEFFEEARTSFTEHYCQIKHSENDFDAEYTVLQNRASLLKKHVIVPLIKKANNHIMDEAINLEVRHCVNALQLAIDSYDSELVRMIVEQLPSEKSNLANLYISEEFVTPLQYAIRKYDYFMQMAECIGHKKAVEPLERREIPNRKNVNYGVLPDDKEFNNESDYKKLISSLTDLEVGCGIMGIKKDGNILYKQQKELFEIIKYLASKTNPISVDTMYYLADQVDQNNPIDKSSFDDVIDIARLLLDTDKVEVESVNTEWSRMFFNQPNLTLLARCIENYNWSMLKLILSHPNSLKRIKPTINRIVSAPGTDSKGNPTIVTSTDLDFFFAKMCEKMPPKVEEQQANEENKIYSDWWNSTCHDIMLLFWKAGARFDIKENQGKNMFDHIEKWQRNGYIADSAIPKEIFK